MKTTTATLLVATCLSLTQCATHSTVYTQASQSSTSPAQALAVLQKGNQRFAAGKSVHRDLPAQVKLTAAGQHPVAAVVSCMDSRTSSELVFDQGLGDIFSIRVAGNVINDDILGSLEYATAAAGARLVVVMGHTKCGAVAGACKGKKMGHLTGLLEKMGPAVAEVKARGGKASPAFEEEVTAANVRHALAAARKSSPILQKLEQQGKIALQGAVYHVEDGHVQWLK